MRSENDQDTGLAEGRRLSELRRLGILDTAPEPEFDDIVQVASSLCHTPVALISLVTEDRQWFKARIGLEARETPLGQAVCRHAIGQSTPLVIEDLAQDPRTLVNPLVTKEPGIRFYAGAPLMTSAGVAIGTLCVIDTAPRPGGLTAAQLTGLEALARHVVRLLEARRMRLERDAQLGEQERRADAAMESAGVGTFEVLVPEAVTLVSPETCRIFGVPVAERYPTSVFEDLVIPADRAQSSNRASRASGTAATHVEYRIRRANDGALRWIARGARFETDAAGRPVRLLGALQDITEEKLATQRTLALVELDEALGRASTVETIGAAAAGVLGQTLGTAGAEVLLLDPGTRQLTPAGAWIAPDAAGRPQQRQPPHPELLARLRAGLTVTVADVTDASWLAGDRDAFLAAGFRAFIEVPIRGSAGLAGTVFAHESQVRSWHDDELRFVRGVAERVAVAFEKVRHATERETIAREMAHRLKNTMAMVQALARQSLRGIAERGAVEAFEQRLFALGNAHDVLLTRDWESADIGTTVVAAIAATGHDENIAISGDPLDIGPRAALAISLIVHELTTNAVKYGALSVPTGRVDVAWSVEGDGEVEGGEPLLTFRWTESGGPPARESARRGFGSTLVRTGLAGTGDVEIDYAETGFRAVMSAPLARLRTA